MARREPHQRGIPTLPPGCLSYAFTLSTSPRYCLNFWSAMSTSSDDDVGTDSMMLGTTKMAPSVWSSFCECEPKSRPRIGISLSTGSPCTEWVSALVRMPDKTSDCPSFKLTLVVSLEVVRPGNDV